MLIAIILITVFVAVVALIVGVALFMRGNDNQVVTDRLNVLTSRRAVTGEEQDTNVLHQPLDEQQNFAEAFVSRFLNLRLYLDQGAIEMPPAKFLMICGGLGLGGFVLSIVIPQIPFIAAPFIAATLAVLPFGYAWWKRRKRLQKFGAQLPDALELIARALRSGHSLAAGFHLVGEEMSQPAGEEFTRVYEEQNLGIPLEEALEGMAERVPNLDLRFFATAVVIQRQSGGDLAEILDKIGHLVRERFKIWGQVQALTGEGRLSGIVLLALPPVLFLTMLKLNPGYVMMLFEDPMGKQMLAAALVLQFIGALVIRKIVSIRV